MTTLARITKGRLGLPRTVNVTDGALVAEVSVVRLDADLEAQDLAAEIGGLTLSAEIAATGLDADFPDTTLEALIE